MLQGSLSQVSSAETNVDENFFFSSSDPQLQESKKIEEQFPAGDQLRTKDTISEPASRLYEGAVPRSILMLHHRQIQVRCPTYEDFTITA